MRNQYIKSVATLKMISDKCIGCGRCLEVCPHGVFEMEEHHAQIKNPDNCMECGACTQNCIAGALSVTSGVGCAVAMINGILTKGDPDLGTCGCGSDSGSGSCC